MGRSSHRSSGPAAAAAAATVLSSLVLLSCCCQQALAISSHSPLDLLAYPAYSVRLSSDPITNSTATRILRDARRSGGDAGIIEGQTPLSSALQHHHPASSSNTAHGGGGAAGAAAAASFKPYLMRSAGQGQGYLCNVPAAAEPSAADAQQQARQHAQEQAMSPEQREAQRRKVEEEKRLAYERGLALLEPLKGTCLYLTIGWFTYAFCHGSEIRQFHAIKVQNPNGLGIAEDPTQDSYTLGAWSNRVMEDEGLMDAKKARALGSLREILASEDKAGEDSASHNAVGFVHGTGRGAFESGNGDEKRYLVQRWAGGTLCDKTGVERKVEVQFHCNSQSTDRIFFIRETAICEYVVVIHTPRLCGEQIFVGSAGGEDAAAHERRRKAVSVIECRPVVPDELLRLAQANQAASARAQLDAAASASEQVVAQKADRHKAGLGQHGKPQPAAPATELNSQARDVSGQQATGPSFDPLPPQPPPRDKAESNERQEQTSSETTRDDDVEEIIDFVLTIDPETGETRVEAEDGSDSRPVLDMDQAPAGDGQPQQGWGADGGTAPELLGGQALDSLLDRLQASIARTLDTLGQAQAEAAPAADAQDGGREPTTPQPGNEREPGGAGAGAARGGAKQGKTDQQLSRLTRSGRGAQHHKDVAKQYIENKLKKQRGGGKGAGGAGQPAGLPTQQQQLGSAQHRLLKQAFAAGVPWQEVKEDVKEDKEGKGAPAQSEQQGQVQAPIPARAGRDEL